MKKIIASLIKGEKYEVAINAARAPYFIVIDNNKYIETIKNPFINGGGAGLAVVELLKDNKCDLFIAGKIGGNLEEKLNEYNIKFEIK